MNSSEHIDPQIIASLVSSFGKVLKELINLKVFKQVTSHKHFRNKQKTIWLLFRNFYCRCANDHHNLSIKRFGKNDKVRALALDISKTFERIWYAELLSKLMISSVTGWLFGLIHSFQTNRLMKFSFLYDVKLQQSNTLLNLLGFACSTGMSWNDYIESTVSTTIKQMFPCAVPEIIFL